jgi:hypothetical protein
MWKDAKIEQPAFGMEVLTFSCYGFVIGSLEEDGRWSAKDTDSETGEPWLRDEGTVTHWVHLPEPPVGRA